MRKLCKFFLCSAVFGFIFLSAMFSLGCGGDDPQCGTDGQPPCSTEDGGTDGTPVKTDGGDDTQIVKDDGGTDGGDPCAPYVGYMDGWVCGLGSTPPGYNCNFNLVVQDGVCYMGCIGHSSCVATPDMLTSNEFTCTVPAGGTQHCIK